MTFTFDTEATGMLIVSALRAASIQVRPVSHGVRDVSRARVLIVEDEVQILGFLQRVVHLEGAEACTADDGASALAHLSDGRPFDLVFLDIGLPDIAGWDVLRYIRARPLPLCDTPVVLLTAQIDDDARRLALAARVPLLAKPVTAGDLRRVIGDHLR